MIDSIGKRIKQQRERLALTQGQVAERLYVTQQTVARWESDKHVPPVKAIQDLATLFDCDAAFFFGENRMVARKFNALAFIGSMVVNVTLFVLAFLVLVPLQLTLIGMTIAGLIAPIAVFWQHVQGIQPLTASRVVASFVMLGIALGALPLIRQLVRYAGRILRAYYRYNLNAIVYEVVPPVQREEDAK
ncbi:helix-turn-helix transcriptional regulator [Lactiplantibacillus fabifermentans]|nr:helix-turn-helix transcriptional regulator [Lactiplantibacillus fabifermentans]ETY74719.1 XRE family transcriptional regulator [Lactiplantibacillus fabifermentans T30PCM01]